jgi:hypothetical protein
VSDHHAFVEVLLREPADAAVAGDVQEQDVLRPGLVAPACARVVALEPGDDVRFGLPSVLAAHDPVDPGALTQSGKLVGERLARHRLAQHLRTEQLLDGPAVGVGQLDGHEIAMSAAEGSAGQARHYREPRCEHAHLPVRPPCAAPAWSIARPAAMARD